MFLGAARNAVFPFRVFSGRKECPLINNMVICESCTECPAVVCIHPLRKLSLPPPRGIRRSWKDYGSTTREECEEKLKVLIAEMKKEIAEIKAGEKATNKG